jgi:hypothetical protein
LGVFSIFRVFVASALGSHILKKLPNVSISAIVDIKANDGVLIVDGSGSFAIGAETVHMYEWESLSQLE